MNNLVFQKRSLYKAGKLLPLSLPLVLPGNFLYDHVTHQVSTQEVEDCTNLQFHLIEETLCLLESISKPVAVLSICGPYRSVKSYFLSRLLGKEETFQLGHTMRACTHGIWLATSVLECQEFSLLVLDTEGMDSVDNAAPEITNLLTLILQVSSMVVYNSKNVPRGKDLKKMRYISYYKCHLQ